ncbi:MAG: alanine--tRNA ligase, partial [Pseudomonadota bacterium]|nr:alanine--tRNA ligase [Pseudomonadota bacterium]
MDHSRSSCFLISDGIIPNNEGRGYVLRRILRRATRFLYNAGIKEPFIYKCADILEKSMGGIYSSLKVKKKIIKEIIYAVEENYLSTLEKGLNLINKLTKNTDKISGEEIFKLYDTYGFPTEIIQEIASEKNISLDMMSFEKLMSKQKNLSKKNTAFSSDALGFVDKNLISSFEGYSQNSLSAKVLAIYKDGSIVDLVQVKDSELIIIFDKTPFYPEGGGQISDIGVLENNDCSLSIVNVQKIGNSIVHKAVLKNGTIKKSDKFNLKIDTRRRKSIAIHHSSTHLLHQALRDVLGNHVEQKGSLVTDVGLRFDFSHNKALSKDEISRIEKIIAFEIDEAKKTSINQMSYKDAIKAGALAFFDEKYEDDVRVLNIGTKSMELCGGTHVDNTNDIKIFKILNEQSISNGVRRIEAVAGNEAYNEFQKAFNLNRDIASLLGVSPDKIANKIDSFKHNESMQQKAIKKLNKQLVSLFSKTINSF